jgi:hypothetical protein
MFADTRQRSGSLERSGWRVAAAMWVAGLVAVLVGWLLAAPPASAGSLGDADVYVQSAKSGELGGGRLALRGVGRRVTWTAHPARFGVVSVKRLHRVLFTRRTTSATGTLYVAGQRGGGMVLRLSRPRYNASRGTVSYRVRRLNKRTLPSRAARPSGILARRFGAASLSIVGAPQVTVGRAYDGNDCTVRIWNATGRYIQLQSFSAWDTDQVRHTPKTVPLPSSDPNNPNGDINMMTYWQTTGPDLRGCSNTAKFQFQNGDPAAIFTVYSVWPWGSGPTFTCTAPAGYVCRRNDQDVVQWEFWPAS